MALNSPLDRTPEHSLLYRFIRLYPHELGRTSVIWIIRFLYRFVFVLSWTLVVAQVSSAFHGEMSLPLLFLFHAVLVFAGSLASYVLFQYFQLESVFLVSLLVGVGALLGVQFLQVSDFIKISVLLFVESCILVQLSINIETFTERLFTPLESSRTFPVVESGDTVATFLAGLLLFTYATSLTPTRVIWVVIGILALLIPLFLQYHSFIRSMPGLCLYRKQLLGHGKREEHQLSLSLAKKFPYLRVLAIIVLSQWFFAVVLEFLFTFSVSSQIVQHAELVPAASGAVENLLIHEFGLLQIFFALGTLFSHFFLAGRVMSSLGIIGSMILHPIVSLLSLAGMVTNFGYFSAVLARMNAEITGVLFRNSYQSSYYVFEEVKSQFVRIVLDGIVRPIGSLLGTFFLLGTFYLVPSKYYVTAVLIGLFFVLLLFLLATIGLQRRYTDQVIVQIKDPETDLELKLSLLDVLGQKGHQHIYPFLRSLYVQPGLPSMLKMKLIEIFSKEQDFIQDILLALSDADFAVRFASLQALSSLEKRGAFQNQLLTREVLIRELKTRYIRESHEDLRYMILLFLAKFKDKQVLDFLLNLLQSESGDSLAEIIQACEAYGDTSFTLYLEQFLAFPDPRVWSSAALCLYKHETHQEKVLTFLRKQIGDVSASSYRALAYVFSEISHQHFLGYMERRIGITQDERERMLLAFGLIKLHSDLGVQVCFEMIFHENRVAATLARRLLYYLPPSLQHQLDIQIQHRALAHLHAFLQRVTGRELEELELSELHYLRDAYTLLNVTEEIIEIDHVIHTKDPGYRGDVSHFGSLPLTPSVYV